MLRTYLLNQRLNTSSFTIETPGGNRVCYQFKGGDIVNRILPHFMTEDPYYQSVIENSDLFKQGIIIYDKQTAKEVAMENARKAQEALAKAQAEAEAEAVVEDEAEEAEVSDLAIEPNIKTVSQAINYCAEKWGVVVKTAKQAKAEALKNGVDFVNLKTK